MSIKKVFISMLIIYNILFINHAYANDVMIIRNVMFETTYTINNYASIELREFKFVNMYAQWEDGKASVPRISESYGKARRDVVYSKKPNNDKRNVGNSFYDNASFVTSGKEAEFAWLKVDVINLQKSEVDFMKDITIKVIYDDEYEYNG